jgi:ABC-type multidrug transport system ATPase subunit
MPALQITDLVKRYPTGTEALKGVSLEIPSGEFFGLLGPNGAGKSTLIHCTTGLAQPTSGEIRVFGSDAWRRRTSTWTSSSRWGRRSTTTGATSGCRAASAASAPPSCSTRSR